MDAPLTPAVVEPLLRGRFGRPYRWLDVTTSTQRAFAADDPEGAVAAADEQTEGRGRLGRSWLAPRGTALQFSLLLRPPVEPARLPELSLVAGGAVAGAIAATTRLEPELKFPNDVLLGGRKVCGILAEAADGRVVLGVGVNVNQTREELPADTQWPATSLRLEAGAELPRAPLLAEILARLEDAYDAWLSAAGRAASRRSRPDPAR